MARLIMLLVLSVSLCSCAKLPGGSGDSAYPYQGPLTDNSGKLVPQPGFDEESK
jgi:hypothetical protein